MSDLVTWLRAQLDEDERRAPLAAEVMALRPSTAPFGARLLAKVDAKRRIVDLHDSDGGHECQAPKDGWGERIDYVRECLTLRLLALPYADRPGYRDEWRP